MPSSRYRSARVLLSGSALVVGVSVLAGCGSSRASSSPPPPTSASTVPATTTTVAPTTTTTVDPSAPPPDPQPSASQASAVFMDGWMAENRARSASVGTPGAVASLYATAYAGQPLNDRGCTDAFPPIICTWGPYAYGSGSIYQVQVTQQGSAWYVSAVTIQS